MSFSPLPSKETFPQKRHIKKGLDFEQVFQARCRSFDSNLIVFCLRTEYPYSRLGLSVSKKVGNSPCRNRWKRLIREAFRRHSDVIPDGYDYVVIPQKLSEPPSQSAIIRSIKYLTVRSARKYQQRANDLKID